MQHLRYSAPRSRYVFVGVLVLACAAAVLALGAGHATPISADQLIPHLNIAAGTTGGEAVPGGIVQITPSKSVGAAVGVNLSTSGGYTSLSIAASNGAKAAGQPLTICIDVRCRSYTLDSGGNASATITPWGGIR